MGAVIQIPCAECLAKNRVPGDRLSEQPVCGRCKERLLPDHPIELTDASFDAFVAGSDLPVVVDFWAEWCAPCRSMGPQLAAAARARRGHVLFAKVNTDAAPRIAARFRIQSIPTLVALRAGTERARQSGLMDAATITRWVDALSR